MKMILTMVIQHGWATKKWIIQMNLHKQKIKRMSISSHQNYLDRKLENIWYLCCWSHCMDSNRLIAHFEKLIDGMLE
jgi:hypothetical protein